MSLPTAVDISIANQELKNFQGLSIRHAKPEDLERISAIESQTTAYPCSIKQLQECIDKIVVLDRDNLVMGFAVIVSVEDQAELHNIAIIPKAQGSGLGSKFLKALIIALPAAIEKFYLEVRVSNYRAIRLYQAMGFLKIAERRDYYRNGLAREDALVMVRTRSK